MINKIDGIKALLSNGDTKEVILKLNRLLIGKDDSVLISNLSARYENLRTKQIKGVLSYPNFVLEVNRINNDLFELLDKIKSMERIKLLSNEYYNYYKENGLLENTSLNILFNELQHSIHELFRAIEELDSENFGDVDIKDLLKEGVEMTKGPLINIAKNFVKWRGKIMQSHEQYIEFAQIWVEKNGRVFKDYIEAEKKYIIYSVYHYEVLPKGFMYLLTSNIELRGLLVKSTRSRASNQIKGIDSDNIFFKDAIMAMRFNNRIDSGMEIMKILAEFTTFIEHSIKYYFELIETYKIEH